MRNRKKSKLYPDKKKSKSKSKKNTTIDSATEAIDSYFVNIDLELANIEKIGSALLVIGYFFFINGSDLDILETLNINNTGLSPTSVTLQGAEIILCGYILLFIVADRRYYEKIDENIIADDKNIISPYERLYFAYFTSIIVNIIRVDALAELDYIDKNSDTLL